MVNIKEYLIESKRILTVTKKPSKEEYMATVKVTILGMLVIGLIGFLVTLVVQIF
jgi:protein transport protein SEC61 subunit gamma-like protein